MAASCKATGSVIFWLQIAVFLILATQRGLCNVEVCLRIHSTHFKITVWGFPGVFECKLNNQSWTANHHMVMRECIPLMIDF